MNDDHSGGVDFQDLRSAGECGATLVEHEMTAMNPVVKALLRSSKELEAA